MKGGWSFVLLPPQPTKSDLPFGWLIVKSLIDDYEINQYKLWPTKDNKLFLPIKAKIRQKIQKQEGDTICLELYEDNSEIVIPQDFLLCLNDNPLAKFNFENMSATSQKQYVDYIFGTKGWEAQANRIYKSLEKLERGLKYHQKLK